MSLSRISTNTFLNQGIYNLQTELGQLSKLQEEVSTGKQLQQPSDNPAGYSQLQSLNNETAQNAVYTTNINEGLTQLNAADTAITSVMSIAQNAHQLAEQAANGTNSTTNLQAISTQVNSLIQQLKQAGNTTVEGQYIFGGFKTNTPPFTTASNGTDIAYNGTPNNADPTTFQRTVQVGQNTTVPVNVNGDALIGHVTVSGTTATGSGLLQSLTQLQLDIQNNNTSGIESGLDNITSNISTIEQLQTQVGNSTNELNTIQNQITASNTNQAQAASSIQDVDMAQAVSQLSAEQTAYQSSLAVMAKVFQTSLINYL